MKVSVMSKKSSVSNVETVERRMHWRDRRTDSDRRSSMRLNLNSADCRSEPPRRAADISGELSDGDVWWNKSVTPYE
jgi:hypothetical protein